MLLGTGLLGLLTTAGCLKPASAGYGTHQQLGLPPCTVQQLFAVRCPACGMTTAWSWVARGNLLRAGQASVGGTVLALTAVIAGPWLVWSGVRGHRVHWPLGDWTTIGMLVGFFLLTLIDWGCRLFFAGR